MKYFLLLSLVLCEFAFAYTRPRIVNFGQFVEVSVDNYEDRDISCSGSLYLTMEDGRQQYEYFSESIRSRGSVRRTFYTYSSERIKSVTDSIFCY